MKKEMIDAGEWWDSLTDLGKVMYSIQYDISDKDFKYNTYKEEILEIYKKERIQKNLKLL